MDLQRLIFICIAMVSSCHSQYTGVPTSSPYSSSLNTTIDPTNFTTYFPLTAQQKLDYQWSKIQATKYDINNLSTSYPPPNSASLDVLSDPEYLKVSFEWQGDEMPGTRNRLIFSPLAVICQVHFVMYNNNTSGYTGLFKSGGIGIIRLALNGLSIPDFAPTGVMKIYIDGKKSENFNMIKNVPGQQANKNFFLNSFSNNIERSDQDDQKTNLAFMQTIAVLQGGPNDRPASGFSLGLYEQASIESDGTVVLGPIVAPYDGRAVPNPQLAIDPNSKNDARFDINSVVKPGMVMYTYWGKRTPDTTVSELLGEIVATSTCDASQYGDEKSFFRQPAHQWTLV